MLHLLMYVGSGKKKGDIKDTDESKRLSSQLMKTVSGWPDVLTFINGRPGNVFMKQREENP